MKITGLLFVVFVSFLSGCASPTQNKTTQSISQQYTSCAPQFHYGETYCKEKSYDISQPDIAGLLAYVVVRVMIESVVHMLIYH